MKTYSLIGAMLALSAVLVLSSCVTTGSDAQASAEKAFDRICTAEPPIYASVSVIAVAKEWKQSKIDKLNGVHTVVTNLCTNRPTDFISALITVTASYAQILAIKAQTE
jgi:hypothetical protein